MRTNRYSYQVFNSSELQTQFKMNHKENILLIVIVIFCALVGLLGIIGNIGLIFEFRKKPLKVRFNALMLTLATFDLIFLLTVPAIAVLTMQAIFSDLFWPLHVSYYFNQVAFTGSILTTITVAAERFLVVCKGTDMDKYAFKWTVATIVTSSLVISLPSPLFAYDLGRGTINATELELELDTSAYVYLIVTICLKFLLAMVPSGLIMFMNISLFKNLRECQTHLEQSESSLGFSSGVNKSLLSRTIFQTKLFLIISFVFITSQALSWIPLIVLVSMESKLSKFKT